MTAVATVSLHPRNGDRHRPQYRSVAYLACRFEWPSSHLGPLPARAADVAGGLLLPACVRSDVGCRWPPHQPLRSLDWRPGTISHIRSWQLIEARGWAAAAVLEDDCALSAPRWGRFLAALADLDRGGHEWDVIYLGTGVWLGDAAWGGSGAAGAGGVVAE